ncbi:MAG: acetate/propionate family kinase [bacterium]|jgi:acetate kinase
MIVLVLDSEAYDFDYLLWESTKDEILARGKVTGVGTRTAIMKHQVGAQSTHQVVLDLPDCRTAMKNVVASLVDPKIGAIENESQIGAVGHRVVHGCSKYVEPALITDEVMSDIADFADYAPKHNPYNLDGIKAARSLLPGVPHVAVFDTSYYMTLPPKAYLYGLPYKYYKQYGIRKYGFHGPSHRYACERACFLAGIPFDEARVISMHLGRGASVTATDHGKCIDTSMGFSPLEGLVMETRCGDVDAEALLQIMSKEDLTPRTLGDLLSRRSGVVGLSGMGTVEDLVAAAKDDDNRAKTTLDVFAHRVRKYLGAYMLELGGVDVVVFTAFMAEGYPIVREMVCRDLDFMGLKLDQEANNRLVWAEGEISAADSDVRVYCIPHNEELIIAQKVHQAISG